MGFLSWRTADTGETIWNVHTGDHRDVYLLQPDGREPIHEPAYAGYGTFAGEDAFVWLAVENGLVDDPLDEDSPTFGDPDAFESARNIGITLTSEVAFDAERGEYHVMFSNPPESIRVRFREIAQAPVHFHALRFDERVPGYGDKTANDLMADGTWEDRPTMEILGENARPLKFSFDSTARYEDLPASMDCPSQGYFPEEDDLSAGMDDTDARTIAGPSM